MNSKVLVCSGNERVDKKEETCSLTKCYHTVCKAGMEGVFDMMGQLSVQQLAVCVCVILGDITARIANPNNGLHLNTHSHTPHNPRMYSNS